MSGNAMKLVVVGAAGRMGQTLIRTIHAIEGAEVFAAVEREGSPFVGRDAGELAGLGPIVLRHDFEGQRLSAGIDHAAALDGECLRHR